MSFHLFNTLICAEVSLLSFHLTLFCMNNLFKSSFSPQQSLSLAASSCLIPQLLTSFFFPCHNILDLLQLLLCPCHEFFGFVKSHFDFIYHIFNYLKLLFVVLLSAFYFHESTWTSFLLQRLVLAREQWLAREVLWLIWVSFGFSVVLSFVVAKLFLFFLGLGSVEFLSVSRAF